MARARNIKPGFFRNAELVELPVEARLLFIGLWTLADREGRLEDRPRQIKMEIYPADQFDVDLMLGQLQDGGFIVRYEVGGRRFIEVANFIKHQDPHYKEKASELPPPPGKENFHKATGVTRTQRQRIMERDGFVCRHCGSEDALCIDHILPVSRGGDSSDENLQVLCAACNARKGNKIGGEEKNSRQRRVDVEASATQTNRSLPSDSLIPDSLIPDPLIPDPLTEPNGSVGSADRLPRCDTQSVVDLYHDTLPELPRVRLMTDGRRKAISAFWRFVMTSKKSDGSPRATSAAEAMEWIGGYFARARDNDFLMGRGSKAPGHEGWQCDFDFLLTDKGKRHVIEKTREAA